MSVQARAICFHCENVIEGDLVFAAPCDHEDCSSACFHPICLMEWREYREDRDRAMRAFVEHLRSHMPSNPFEPPL